MREIREHVTIAASPERTWEVLSDLTAMRNYMPGLEEVQITSETSDGIGAARRCRFEDGTELHERVIRWEPGKGYTLETVAFAGVPMRSNVISFQIDSHEGRTRVTQAMRYEMKGWVFAPLMERAAQGMMKRALRGALGGLKSYVEK